MADIKLVLPYPPSELLPNRKTDRWTKAKVTRASRQEAALIAFDYLNQIGRGRRIALPCPLIGRCSMTITWYPRTQKIADCDSLMRASKPFFDGLKDGWIIKDDSWDVIVERTLRRGPPDKDNPRTEIIITALEDKE